MEAKSENRVRVNGLLLGKSIGKEVSIVGTVLNVVPDRSSFDLKTSDGHVVTVTMRQPLSSQISGIIEAQGIVRTKDTILCDYHIAFPDQLAEEYDADIVNEVAILTNSIPNPWKQ